MLRTLIAGVLGLVLAMPTTHLSAQSTLLPSGVSASGRAFGAWDLPGDRDAGSARGYLLDLSGRRFLLEAKLLPVPVRGGSQGGRMLGVLIPLDRDGIAGRPVAEVHGGYVAGPDGLGRFEAAITMLAPRIERIGRIEGRFADPLERGKDPVGRFVGRWALR